MIADGERFFKKETIAGSYTKNTGNIFVDRSQNHANSTSAFDSFLLLR